MIQDGLELNLKLLIAMRESLRQFSITLADTDDIREVQIGERVDECYQEVTRLRDYLEARTTQRLARAIDNGEATDD